MTRWNAFPIFWVFINLWQFYYPSQKLPMNGSGNPIPPHYFKAKARCNACCRAMSAIYMWCGNIWTRCAAVGHDFFRHRSRVASGISHHPIPLPKHQHFRPVASPDDFDAFYALEAMTNDQACSGQTCCFLSFFIFYVEAPGCAGPRLNLYNQTMPSLRK